MRLVLICLAASMYAASAQPAPPSDRKGCVDSKVLSRMPGCFIQFCDYKEYNAGNMPRKRGDKNMIEGEYESIKFVCAKEKSPLEIGRNVEAALKQAGFNIIFSEAFGIRSFTTAHKGPQWVHAYVEASAFFLTTVKQKQMDQAMKANSDAWAEQVQQTGRVSVYGINFDTGKATLRPESDPVLQDVAKMLQANASWVMVVAGHTDNVGAKELNLNLSRQRADSVVTWLGAHGVEKTRLLPAGFGDTRPVAENAAEEGRQKNRRVDLVKLY